MKYSLALVAFVAVIISTNADPTGNIEPHLKQFADALQTFAKKYEEITGLKTDFDKDKFSAYLSKTLTKFQDDLKKLYENAQANSKNLPEDLKKKYEEATKVIEESLKGLSNPEVKKKADAVHETITTSLKKVSESVVDLSKSFGLVIPKSLEKTFSEISEEIQKTSKTFQEKGQKILEGIQEELKKKKAN